MRGTLRLADIMATHVKSVAAADPAEWAWHLMRQRGIHHLVVTGDGGIVGVLSDRDMGGRCGQAFRMGRRVGELMTRDVVTAHPRTTVRQAANLMRGRSIGCLPVLSGKKLVGILTSSDLLGLVATRVDPSIRHRVRQLQRAAPKSGPRRARRVS